jgi:hypothetical protein
MSQLTSSALCWLCTILKERFGNDFLLETISSGLKLSLTNTKQGSIIFPKLEAAFHQSRSDFPCSQWDADKAGWVSVLGQPLPAPCVSELPEPLIVEKTSHIEIHYDILGLTYWTLNRIEEIDRTDLDIHERFPATNSHAHIHGYLERPIVDEWLHLLGQVILKVWPNLQLRQHQFSMKVSHDVDSPSLYAFKPWKAILRMMAGNLLKRGNLKTTLQAPWLKIIGGKKIPKKDPYNTFNFLMNISEANNLTSAFYFICGGNHLNDADYQLEEPRIRKLMRQLHKRGHEIGLHPSYATYLNPAAIKQEAERLRDICKEEGIEQSVFGGRMHYLRWKQPSTLQAWEDAGMAYDSTLTYADRPGFRCGTCHEYPAFNPVMQQALKIRIRPLIAMECTVIDEVYLGLGATLAAQSKFLELKDKCRKVQGCFTLLWHNSYLSKKRELKEIYTRSVEG